MRVAILSDIHDNLPKLRAALARMDNVGELICLGDLCSPFIVKELAEGFAGPIHIVFGNNDGDRFRITEAAGRYAPVKIYGEYVELVIAGKTFAVNHFDNLGREIARAQSHDVICFGHNHRFEISEQGRSLIINPGEIYGLLTGESTFVIYDTASGRAERVDVD